MEARRSELAALSVALVLPLVSLIVHPWVERPINDDWSYSRSAQLLASTGHVIYNSWSTAILGAQLYVGALFIRLFGFSFSVLRASILLIAMLTAVVYLRALTRAGLNATLALLGALTLVLSPVYLALSFSFMSDMWGLCAIVLALYGCICAVRSGTDRAALLWLAFAAIANTIAGSGRQIALLGTLVMVPSTLWLLRRRRALIAPVLAVLGVCDLFIFLLLRWYAHQPLSVPEALIPGPLSAAAAVHLVRKIVAFLEEMPFFLLPALALFFSSRSRLLRSTITLVIAAIPAGAIVFLLRAHGQAVLSEFFFPTLGNCITVNGLMFGATLEGEPPIVLGNLVQILITAFSLLAAANLLFFLWSHRADRRSHNAAAASGHEPEEPGPHPISLRALCIIVGPFAICYLLLLLPRAAFGPIFDRYLLPLVVVAIPPILLLYQQILWPRLEARRPTLAVGYVVLAVIALCSIAGIHDMFAFIRAEQQAVSQVLGHGTPATSLDGGFEFNGWTQLEQTGYVADPHNFTFPNATADQFLPVHACQPLMGYLFPSLHPSLALSYQSSLCLGDASWPPVPYFTWLPPRKNYIHVIRVRDANNLSPVPRTR